MQFINLIRVRVISTAILVMAVVVSAPLYAKSLFLWKVAGPQATVWLYGTIHVGKPAFFPLPKPVTEAFEQSDILAVEVNTLQPDVSQSDLVKMTQLPAGDTLARHIGKNNWTILQRELPKRYQLNADQFKNMSAWLAASLLGMVQIRQQGLDNRFGIDAYFTLQASAKKKEILALESYALQIRQLAALDDATTTEWLMSFVDDKKAAQNRSEIEQMVSSWENGQPDQLNQIFIENQTFASEKSMQNFEQKLLLERNPAMANKIIDLINGKKNAFVAVGALHYAGPKNIIQLLQQSGYHPVQQFMPD